MMLDEVLLAGTMAVAAGLVGCFAVMRRLALAADPLSHVALPGIGIALALNLHPLLGALAMLFVGALLVLMGALIIVPAATAKRLSVGLREMMLISVGLSV